MIYVDADVDEGIYDESSSYDEQEFSDSESSIAAVQETQLSLTQCDTSGSNTR